MLNLNLNWSDYLKMKFKTMFKNIKKWRIYLAIREIINFAYIRRTARKNKKTAVWQSFNLRVDWVGRIYTVVNLRKEDAGDDEMIKRARLMEQMAPINKYLKTLDLHEIMFPAIEKKSDRSYLVVYSPLFTKFTILYFFRILFIIALLITGIVYLNKIISGIEWLINLF